MKSFINFIQALLVFSIILVLTFFIIIINNLFDMRTYHKTILIECINKCEDNICIKKCEISNDIWSKEFDTKYKEYNKLK